MANPSRGIFVRFVVVTACLWGAIYASAAVLPIYALQLGASLSMVGLVVGAYGITQVICRIPIGLASDRIGRRKPFIAVGLVAAALGGVGLLFAGGPVALVLSRAVLGLTASAWVVATVFFAGFFAAGGTTRAIAVASVVSGVAQIVATAGGGWLADRFGDGATFTAGIVLAVVGLLFLLTIPDRREPVRSTSLHDILRAMASPRLLRVSLVAAVGQYSFWATTYAFVPLYVDRLGADKTAIGVVTAMVLIPAALVPSLLGRLRSRFGAPSVTVAGFLLITAGTLATPRCGSVAAVALVQVCTGVGRGLSQPLLMARAIEQVAPHERATSMGVFQALYALGIFIGPATAGSIGQAVGLTGAFLVSGLLCLLAAGVEASFARLA